MAGRKPKPTAIKEMLGNPGKRPLNEGEPKPTGVPKCPRQFLSPLARKEWKRIAKELAPLGLLTNVDRSAMAIYCAAWARWTEAHENIVKFGEVIKTHNGNPIQNPYRAIANRAEETILKVAAEFGMTPSARSRISVLSIPGGHAEKSRAASYFEEQPAPGSGSDVLQ
jgi:P27 family predicted phage terminase small subunit